MSALDDLAEAALLLVAALDREEQPSSSSGGPREVVLDPWQPVLRAARALRDERDHLDQEQRRQEDDDGNAP